MELQRQLAIGALDLLFARAPLHTQYFVVVSFYVARQKSLLVFWIARDLDHCRPQKALFQFVSTL
jgi:hypothetical protein